MPLPAAEDGKWITSRWEDKYKSDGTFRARWVLRWFTNEPGEDKFFSPTPAVLTTSLAHIWAQRKRFPIRYVDVTTAFLHAPEHEHVFTAPPAGYEREGFCWKLQRKVNGRRSGSRDYTEWFAGLLVQRGFERGVLDPCLFVHREKQLVYVMHVDDILTTGPAEANDAMLEDLGKHVLLKISEPLDEGSGEHDYRTFLSRLRSRDGARLYKRVSERFVLEAADGLGLRGATPARTPAVTDKNKRAPKDDEELDSRERLLFRSTVGKLLWVQEDYAEATYEIKELSRQMARPRASGLARVNTSCATC